MDNSRVIFCELELIAVNDVLILAKSANPNYNIIFFFTAFFNYTLKFFAIRLYLLPVIHCSLILNQNQFTSTVKTIWHFLQCTKCDVLSYFSISDSCNLMALYTCLWYSFSSSEAGMFWKSINMLPVSEFIYNNCKNHNMFIMFRFDGLCITLRLKSAICT